MDQATSPTAHTGLGVLTTSDVALLTSFKKDGSGVGTPVGVTVSPDGQRAYFTTRSRAWKVARIARNPAVTLAPSDKMGVPLGETVECVARRMDDSEVRRMRKGVEYQMWRFIYAVAHRDEPVTYEVVAAAD